VLVSIETSAGVADSGLSSVPDRTWIVTVDARSSDINTSRLELLEAAVADSSAALSLHLDGGSFSVSVPLEAPSPALAVLRALHRFGTFTKAAHLDGAEVVGVYAAAHDPVTIPKG
jgi:hypothetical protein